ncbi:MAG TPA: GtrA family protein [Bacilli bacterium]|jgi:dolichol-phosphate mannosyltransferase|nr:GtrA family protein [Bacilli bacterium]HPZ23941.1 GtrA family protein [Bacilli bacterium]HQC83700.1 GtrA family protein [Bacilli bacterium]
MKFIKASISSMISAGIDLGIYTLIAGDSSIYYIILIATIVARIISSLINFIINKKWAFKSNGKTTKELIYFYILFIAKLLASSLLVWSLSNTNINHTILKALVDIFLFFISYYIQSKYIFKNKNNDID